MIVTPTSRLRARTAIIEDPGPLHRFLPESGPRAAFLRRGDGFVAIGEVLRFETDSAEAADVWWTETVADIEHETEIFGEWGTGPIAIGSFTFDPDHSDDNSVLILPRHIIGRRGDLCWHTQIGNLDDFALPRVESEPERPASIRFADGSMPGVAWEGVVREVINLIHRGEVQKVVLARDLIADSDTPLDPRYLVQNLGRQYPACWTFLVHGLIGATPELLIRKQGGLATSRVLAGTIRRTSEPDDAMRLATHLASSDKDVNEHAFAVASVMEKLRPYCSGMNVPEVPYVLDLPNVLHLATEITGVIEDETTTALALAGALHPSAAVCGTPMHTALDIINELESLDRGRYAGPVGWIDAQGDGEFAIALRCGQINPSNPREIQLFAGCGIVGESDPASELAEAAAKLVPMRDALST